MFLVVLMLFFPLASCMQIAEEQTTNPPTTTEQPTQTSATSVSNEETNARESAIERFRISAKAILLYEYYNDEDALQLELYYDKEKERGIGIFYGTGVYEHEGIVGFQVGAAEKAVWKDHKFLITTEYHDDVSYAAVLPGYEEQWAYNKQGKPTEFHVTIQWEDEEAPLDRSRVTWHYRKDGTLWKKDSFVNTDGWRGSERFYYDAKERPIYVNAYYTAGYVEDYYIYGGDSEAPSYRLTLVHALGPAYADEFVKY